jgi:hypothetical protein
MLTSSVPYEHAKGVIMLNVSHIKLKLRPPLHEQNFTSRINRKDGKRIGEKKTNK